MIISTSVVRFKPRSCAARFLLPLVRVSAWPLAIEALPLASLTKDSLIALISESVAPTEALGVEKPAVAGYAGLATRAISFVIDAALIALVATVVGVGAALILSLFHLPKNLHDLWAAIGVGAYVLWSVGYFVVFWSATGQTPGARLLQIRVVTADGDTLKPRRALVRAVGTILASIPLFLGFVPVLYDRRRRALQDYLARSFVVTAPQLSVAEVQRARLRSAGRPLDDE